ncbi:MAG: hypothetical protein ABIR26_18410, partial [Ramlibacter sp.]
MSLKVDYRAGPDSRMRSNIDKVEAALGRVFAAPHAAGSIQTVAHKWPSGSARSREYMKPWSSAG